VSFFIGSIPIFLLNTFGASGDYLVGGEPLVERGRITAAGYFANLETAGISGLLASVTGLVWLAIAGNWKRR